MNTKTEIETLFFSLHQKFSNPFFEKDYLTLQTILHEMNKNQNKSNRFGNKKTSSFFPECQILLCVIWISSEQMRALTINFRLEKIPFNFSNFCLNAQTLLHF